ncbi:hypothetical protein GGS21DRAFT_521061 [Xylaria nigripes]|nr:hypothetical protein GGS21DRAFT_521061 [Xylaria nigripes]
MDQLPVEILHLICSQLSVRDVANFRLVNNLLAAIGAAYMLPAVTFRISPAEIDRLKAISLHPIFSKYVRSITYGTETFHPSQMNAVNMTRYFDSPAVALSNLHALTPYQYTAAYDEYYDNYGQQAEPFPVEINATDLFREILPRFPNLNAFTVMVGDFFDKIRYLRRERSHFAGSPRGYTFSPIYAEDKHPLQMLLMANAHAPRAVKSLHMGSVHWQFFGQNEQNLLRMFQPLANLTSIELNIAIHSNDGLDTVDLVMGCRNVLSRGSIRKILTSMPQLQFLCVDIEDLIDPYFEKGAWLKDVIEPGFHWPNLRELALGGMMADRTEIMDVLMQHKNTLQKLCLRNITLSSTSWWKLLPDIRRNLYLQDVCICGILHGKYENGDPPARRRSFQSWRLLGDTGDTSLWESVNMYCRLGGTKYPDEIPLQVSSRRTYQTYFIPLGFVSR